MSNIYVSIEQISAIETHPNADRLEVAIILGTQTIVPKGEYHVGQKVVFFPPDILIPESCADSLGIKKYLKHALLDGIKQQCRVAACRIRGISSFGFIIPASDKSEVGVNCSDQWNAQKYEPPIIRMQGDNEHANPAFHKYTDIEAFWKHPDAIPPGTLVRITEKIHGTNCRIGMIGGELMCGSHHCSKREYNAEGTRTQSLYWRPATKQVIKLLEYCSSSGNPAIIFGEIFGPGVQDLDYGIPQGQIGFRVFDISVNGDYLNWQQVSNLCDEFDLATVPVLYIGPFTPTILKMYVDGPSRMEGKSKFKGREGVVITPLVETHSWELNGRLILKYHSADYLDRKNAQDNEG